jgi:biopolymer transport protein ExbD
MSKFRKKKSSGDVGINTSALPDIVFMLLFFFMVATKMRDVEMKVRTQLPKATEVEKLEKKSLVNYIYVGPPVKREVYGETPRIQLNDAFATVDDVQQYITQERTKVDEGAIPFLTTSIKGDVECKMGIITDIKQELRKVNALKLNYSASRDVTRE